MALDADLFTLETFADLREKDIIKTVRISPRDAQRGFCALDLKRKMAGDEAFHFGGFFKKSWRANDILWGRADAACQLTEMLLERERVREVVRSPRHRPELQARVAKGGDLHPAQLFPKAPPALQQALEEWLLALVGDTEPRPCDDDGSRWERGVSQLIECAQYEFLGEEICNVLKDAVSEQLDWNYSRQEIGKLTDIGRQGVANAGKFGLASGRWGSTVHAYVSEAAGEQAKAHLSDPGRLKAFFTERYSVGSESMGKDVPSWILLEILFRGLLVAKDAFTFALPVSWRGKVTASLPYRLLTAGLWMLYGLALTLRSGDRTAIAVRFSVFAVSAFTWLLLIVGGSQLVCTAGGPSLLKAALLVSPTIALMMMFPKSRWWGLSLGIVVLVLAKFGIRC